VAHCNNGRSERPKNETQVTPWKRNLLVSVGVSLAGIALSAGIVTGVVEPDQATALATVAGTTITSVLLLVRRPTTAPEGPDQGGPVSLEK
jgi:hypothetical protein